MIQAQAGTRTYRYLSQRTGSAYRELFVSGTSLRAQSLVSDMENQGLSPAEIAADFHIPLEAVLEAIEYVRENEAYLAAERQRVRGRTVGKGYLLPEQA